MQVNKAGERSNSGPICSSMDFALAATNATQRRKVAGNIAERRISAIADGFSQRFVCRQRNYIPQAGDNVVAFSDIHARCFDDRLLARNPKLSLNALLG